MVLGRRARALREFADQLAEFIVETRKSLFQSSDVLIDATDKTFGTRAPGDSSPPSAARATGAAR
jgi:hypothetical protein